MTYSLKGFRPKRSAPPPFVLIALLCFFHYNNNNNKYRDACHCLRPPAASFVVPIFCTAPCFRIPSISVLTLIKETKFHTCSRLQVKLHCVYLILHVCFNL
jgi:hypothetical protein